MTNKELQSELYNEMPYNIENFVLPDHIREEIATIITPIVAKIISSKPMLADSLKPLIVALEEYQKLLSDELDDVTGLLHVHAWHSKRYEEGKKMRERITELKAVLNFR